MLSSHHFQYVVSINETIPLDRQNLQSSRLSRGQCHSAHYRCQRQYTSNSIRIWQVDELLQSIVFNHTFYFKLKIYFSELIYTGLQETKFCTFNKLVLIGSGWMKWAGQDECCCKGARCHFAPLVRVSSSRLFCIGLDILTRWIGILRAFLLLHCFHDHSLPSLLCLKPLEPGLHIVKRPEFSGGWECV